MVDFVLPTCREFACAMTAEPEFQFFKKWLETYQVPTPDALSAKVVNSRGFAQLRASLALRNNIIVLRTENDQQRELFIVSADSITSAVLNNYILCERFTSPHYSQSRVPASNQNYLIFISNYFEFIK